MIAKCLIISFDNVEIAELEMPSITGEPFSFGSKEIEDVTMSFKLGSPINFDLFKGCKTRKKHKCLSHQPWKRRGKNTKV